MPDPVVGFNNALARVTSAGSTSSAAAAGGSSGWGTAASILGAPVMAGMDYGLNAAATSKAHDRNKNYLTRKYQYEMIALKEAGINPAYLLSQLSPGTSTRAPQQAGHKSNPMNPGFISAAAQVENIKAQTDLTRATAEKTRAETKRVAPEIANIEGRTRLFGSQADLADSQRGLNDAQRQWAQRELDNVTPEMIQNKFIREGQAGTWPQAIIDFMSKIDKGELSNTEEIAATGFLGYLLRGEIEAAIKAGYGAVKNIPPRQRLMALIALGVAAKIFTNYEDGARVLSDDRGASGEW